MSEKLPAPLVGPEVDCSDLDGFMLNAERLMSSELLALHGNEILGAALLLRCRAWKQRPAGSLPDDDRVNAAFARMPMAKFRRLKGAIMRGFVKCSDGRLYHKVLAVEAANAFERKVAHRKRREAEAKRLREWRNSERKTASVAASANLDSQNKTRFETANETGFVADGNGKDRDRDRDNYRKDLSSRGPKESPSRGTRLPSDWAPTETDWSEGQRLLGSKQAEVELAKFRDYWRAKAGRDGVKLGRDLEKLGPQGWRALAEQISRGSRPCRAIHRPGG